MSANEPIACTCPVLVTGASGFLGGELVRRLRAAGRPVRAVSRSAMPELAALGAETIRADVTDAAAMHAACAGVETAFHAAARVGIWVPRAEFEHTNIGGAQNMVAACRTADVRRLIFTSSPSVVFTGGDLAGADESTPLGTDFPSDYPRTKAAAERIILKANEPGRLATVALRPHLIWGVGDRYLIPLVVAHARAGRLRIVGSGQNRVDLTHVQNVVDAHLNAEIALAREDSRAAGRAYFITNGEPVVLWEWINDLLRQLDVAPVTRQLSLATAQRIGAACEVTWRVLRRRSDPPMTRFLALELAHDHWFDIAAARRDLGYAPRVSMAEGLAELVSWLRGSIAQTNAT
jgi:2-alkyl-3-oxoalkanoate reductase